MGALAVAYEEATDRILLVAEELVVAPEPDEDADPDDPSPPWPRPACSTPTPPTRPLPGSD